jgi:hypothetical protein
MIGDYLPVIGDYLGLTLQETLLAIAVVIMVLMLGKVGKK